MADGHYPALEAAVQGEVADAIVATWTALAIGQSATGDYIRGLHAANSILHHVGGDPLAVSVVNVSPHAGFVEEGHEAFHLPDRIKNWKLTKKGKRIVTVPFRHFAPASAGGGATPRALKAAMPAHIYAMTPWLGGNARLTGLGDRYKLSRPYAMHRRQGEAIPESLGHHSTWKSSKYEGLQKHGGATPGGGSHSTYLTFRTITPESKGWWIPALAGKHYADQTVQAMRPQIEPILAAAAAADLVAHFGASMASTGATVTWEH